MPLSPQRRYSLLCQFWSLAFVVTGLLFAFAPRQLGQQMAAAGALLGLTGHVDWTPGTPWHVIALSLMLTVTLLAWQSARQPMARDPYVTLQAAKVFSTLLFSYLAVTDGSIWVLCAITDGSIALSLFLARLSLPTRTAGTSPRSSSPHPQR